MDDSDSDREEGEQEIVLGRYRIRTSDFTPEMEKRAIKIAQTNMAKLKMDKEIATAIIKELEDLETFSTNDEGAWHVIVGKHFASSITYATKFLLFVDLLEYNKTMLLFMSG